MKENEKLFIIFFVSLAITILLLGCRSSHYNNFIDGVEQGAQQSLENEVEGPINTNPCGQLKDKFCK